MKRKVSAFIFLALALACMAFIFSNSLKSAQASKNDSNSVLEVINDVLEDIGIDSSWLTSHIVRKAAHFCEFALLGCLACICLFLFKTYYYPAFAVVWCFFTASSDEIIQLFSEDRACRFTDVLIDTMGATSGTLFALLLLLLAFGNRIHIDETSGKSNRRHKMWQ